MAIAQNIQTGGSTAGQANVDANFNLNVVLPQALWFPAARQSLPALFTIAT